MMTMIVVLRTSPPEGNVVRPISSRTLRKKSRIPPFDCLVAVSTASDIYLLPKKFGLAGVPGLEPGPKVLETSMLTIDTIPLKSSAKFRAVSYTHLRAHETPEHL